jgi:signal transduction histidine kinase
MESKRRNLFVYGLLAAVWVLICAWQVADHRRVQNLARAELIHRAKDASATVGTTIRLLRRFGGVVSQERLENAFTELVRAPGDWDGVALLNEAGVVVASVGTFLDHEVSGGLRAAETWRKESVTLINPIALGTNVTRDLEGVIVVVNRPNETNRPPGMREGDTNAPAMDRRRNEAGGPGHEEMRPPPPPDEGRGRDSDRPRGSGRRMPRPSWWTEEEWKAIQERQGIHSFAVVMSTKRFREASSRDLWLRAIIVSLAAISVAGVGLAWRSLAKSSFLQLRLVRASELNTHLKEMNLAAAGLAHETRNPLNIIRGMAQMLSKQAAASPEIRERSRAIVDETDKVTAQLNEFINYSRPREVRRSVVALHSVSNDVARALGYDLEEKKIRLEIKGEPISIETDEQMLRQVLFNLVLNAIQAVGEGGEIAIFTQRQDATEAVIEIRDDGPGVPLELRREIFKPYVTTQRKGTGLGLAIVQQIVLAHGWEIECLARQPKGAVFRITHLRLAAKS